jgi:endonuclease YncB( thermonuclease family)
MPELKIAVSRYRKLVDDITHLYESAKESLARFYWGTGKRIVEVEQKGETRAPYGKGLIQTLARDLTQRLGKGFSKKNLERMRAYYMQNPIAPSTAQLTWTQQAGLLQLKDKKARLTLEKRAIREGLTSRQIRALVQKKMGSKTDGRKKEGQDLPPLKRPTDLRLHTYQMAELPEGADQFRDQGTEWLDLGFYVRRSVAKSELKQGTLTDKPAYTFAAIVDRIVDGDTLIVVMDAGFGNVVHWRLRLRGIDCPELDKPEGEAAKRFVEGLLPKAARLVIKSTKTDVHGRFVADVFFLGGGSREFEEIAHSGVWLNQHLLDQGLAVRMKD